MYIAQLVNAAAAVTGNRDNDVDERTFTPNKEIQPVDSYQSAPATSTPFSSPKQTSNPLAVACAPNPAELEDCVNVLSVTDGDTLKYKENGEEIQVRLLGIDSTEKGEKYYQDAKDALTTLVNKRNIKLSRDQNPEVDNKDFLGRLLRYVSPCDSAGDPREINLKILEAGLACTFRLNKLTDVEVLKNAQNEAKRAKVGGWKDNPEDFCLESGDGGPNPKAVCKTSCGDSDRVDGGPVTGPALTCNIESAHSCLCVAGINEDGDGDPKGEYVALGNVCSGEPLVLTGWTVSDAKGKKYIFSAPDGGVAPSLAACAGAAACAGYGFQAAPGCTGTLVSPIKLYTKGSPTLDTEQEFHWGRNSSIWNDNTSSEEYDDTVNLTPPGSALPTASCSY